MYSYIRTAVLQFVLLTRIARINFINSLFRCCKRYGIYVPGMYMPLHSSPGGVPFLGYCCSGVLGCTYSRTLYSFFFVSAIETLIVVVCHVLFVTTVWISENELRESINIIIMMLISAHVLVVLPTDVPHRSPSYA